MMGNKIWKDRKSEVMMSSKKSTPSILHRWKLTRQKEQQPWRIHQSLVAVARGRCSWVRCLRIKKCKAKRKCAYNTFVRCKECTAMQNATYICATIQRMMWWQTCTYLPAISSSKIVCRKYYCALVCKVPHLLQVATPFTRQSRSSILYQLI